ncbi:hypothetical protein ACS0TY_012398 [Phlomoides rotata]
MVKCTDEKITMAEEPLLKNTADKKGGFKTLPFILANEAFEKMATNGLMTNMILYLMKQYNMEMTFASNLLFFWSSATTFMPFVGAIIADSFLGRFYTIGIGSVICLLGMILLWSTTIIPEARPPPCDPSVNRTCKSATSLQFMYLCISLGLISIGAGGIGSSSLVFGANQLENGDSRESSRVKQTYFSWYYASCMFSAIIALTCVVYIQDKMGWEVGFAVPAVLMLLSVVSFFLASPLYVKLKASGTNLITSFIQVAIACYRNRDLKLSEKDNDLYHHKTGSALVSPSRKLRFLNKACIVANPEKNLMSNGRAADEWSLCTAEQVEELKALFRVIPIWSTGALLFVNISQPSFPVLQASSMDRRITSGLVIPAASFGLFSVISVIIWITLNDRVFLPVASRLVGTPVHVSTRTRMGIGIFLSFLAMFVTAVVESIRLGRVKGDGLEGRTMSAMWLVPQYCLNGFATAANDVAQMEFYLSELPRSMSAVAANLDGLGITVGNLVASFVMNIVDGISRLGGRKTWISSKINEGHYDYYYLVLTGLSLANMVYYVVCVRAYGPLKEEKIIEDESSISG